jgi:hypothetical protein
MIMLNDCPMVSIKQRYVLWHIIDAMKIVLFRKWSMMPMRNYCLKKVKQSRFRANFSVHTRILVHVFRLKDKITYVKFLHITQIVSLLFVVHSDILESDDSSSNNLSPCARHSRIFNTWSNRKSCSSRGTRSMMHDENKSQFFFLCYSIFLFQTQ